MRSDRKRSIEEHARLMLDEHGLSSTIVEWSNAKRIFGQYRWDRATGREYLRLSLPLASINTDDVVLDTIAHEVAHGIAGHRAGHGPRWAAACKLTGARPERIAHEAEPVPARWVGTCETCGTVVRRHRLTKALKASAIHPSDGGRIRWKENR